MQHLLCLVSMMINSHDSAMRAVYTFVAAAAAAAASSISSSSSSCSSRSSSSSSSSSSTSSSSSPPPPQGPQTNLNTPSWRCTEFHSPLGRLFSVRVGLWLLPCSPSRCVVGRSGGPAGRPWVRSLGSPAAPMRTAHRVRASASSLGLAPPTPPSTCTAQHTASA